MQSRIRSASYGWPLLLCALGASGPASALNVLLTNDDGFEASTLHAVYRLLQEHGYGVIIASETQDNSGKGGSGDFFRPLGPLTRDSRAGFIKAGAPGIGHLATDTHVFYVDGTPVAAALYGLDIAAPLIWGKPPDLVISGPNYGNNTGLANTVSGTVNAALICLNRGISAIAVSTANPLVYKSFDRLAPGDAESEVAAVVLRLIQALETQRKHVGDPMLPKGLGLNVNIPAFAPGAASRLKFKAGRVGTASLAVPVFVEDLSQDPAVRVFGLKEPALPGVSFLLAHAAVGDHSIVTDTDPLSEQNVVDTGEVAISVMRGNNGAESSAALVVGRKLTAILNGADH